MRDLNELEKENEQLRQQRNDLLRQLSEYENRSIHTASDQLPLAEMSNLIDGIIHDMSNGLGLIRQTIQFLEDLLVGYGHRKDFLKILRSLEFCRLVLRNLAALSGEDVVEPKLIDLKNNVEEVYSMLERKLFNVELDLDLAPDASEIVADEGQIKQIFMNLIKNAGEAMPDGGTFTFRSRREGEMLRLEFIDTGCGMSPENQARLFKEFFTTKARGYGIGLHVVNTIVNRHGGRIEVESEEGEGTTFILHLPRVQER
jgi:signal transduction histidine kinase